jgi:hypothetical protein
VNISKNVELTPHTFRRAFATYHANSGMPLPLLSKLLGHSSIRTTALYWQNIYDDDDPSDILTGKRWLEQSPLAFDKDKEKQKEPPKPPREENDLSLVKTFDKDLPNFPKTAEKPKPIIRDNPVKPVQSDNPPLTTETKKNPAIANYQPSKIPEKISLNTSERLPVITKREQIINQEQVLLEKIRNLEQQLAQSQAENKNLTNQLAKSDQAKKELVIKLANSETLAQTEKNRADQAEAELKTVAKSLYQQYKISYYQQLEQERKAQIEQSPKPPKWKN